MPGLFTILSPAKTLDMEADAASAEGAPTKPRLAAQTRTLAGELRDYSPKRLEKLMSISAKLAGLNAGRWQDFGTRGNPRHSAALCFRGDVYQGLEAWTMKMSGPCRVLPPVPVRHLELLEKKYAHLWLEEFLSPLGAT